MTPQEQFAVIVQMTVERADASRPMVLLLHKIQETSKEVGGLSAKLGGVPYVGELREALPLLDELIAVGGLDEARRVLNEYLELADRSIPWTWIKN